jgi:hypothetical protein
MFTDGIVLLLGHVSPPPLAPKASYHSSEVDTAALALVGPDAYL